MNENPSTLFDPERTFFLSWSYSRRSEDLSALLGIPYEYFPLNQAFRLLQFPILFFKTLLLLFRKRPEIVFVQHPPIHILLPVLFYSLLSNGRFVIDSHITPGTTLVEKPHHWFYLLLHRLYSFFAEVTLFHSQAILDRSERWWGNYLVLENPVRNLELKGDFPVKQHPAVGMVTSFSPDEYVGEVIDAAKDLPDITFYITGSEGKIPPQIKNDPPENITFTGYVSGTSYYEFLRAMDIVVVLTDREESALLGAYESISAETPLVVSDTTTMRRYFPLGTMFTQNGHDSISATIQEAIQKKRELEAGIKTLKQRKLKGQMENFKKIATLAG